MGAVISMQRSRLLDTADVREDHGAVRREAAQQRASPSHTEGRGRRERESCRSEWEGGGPKPEQGCSGCSCPWRAWRRRRDSRIRLKAQRLRHQMMPKPAKQYGLASYSRTEHQPAATALAALAATYRE